MNDENTKYVLEKFVIYHNYFSIAQRRIERCFKESLNRTEPTCFAIIGESRTGKTLSLEHYEQQYPRIRHEDGLEVPILRVKVPSKPTVKGLVSLLLNKIGDPMFDKGTEQAQTDRLKKLLKSAKTRLIMLDEFQHFYDQGTQKVQHYVADWLKILVDESKVGLVVAGLETSVHVIKSNDQLHKRFIRPVMLKRFDWRISSDRNEFLDILFAIKNCLDMFSLPDIESEEVGFKIYCATGGLLGYVIKIFKFVLGDAVDGNKKTITMKDISIAADEALFIDDNQLSPFSKEFGKSDKETIVERMFSDNKHKLGAGEGYYPKNASELFSLI